MMRRSGRVGIVIWHAEGRRPTGASEIGLRFLEARWGKSQPLSRWLVREAREFDVRRRRRFVRVERPVRRLSVWNGNGTDGPRGEGPAWRRIPPCR